MTKRPAIQASGNPRTTKIDERPRMIIRAHSTGDITVDPETCAFAFSIPVRVFSQGQRSVHFSGPLWSCVRNLNQTLPETARKDCAALLSVADSTLGLIVPVPSSCLLLSDRSSEEEGVYFSYFSFKLRWRNCRSS